MEALQSELMEFQNRMITLTLDGRKVVRKTSYTHMKLQKKELICVTILITMVSLNRWILYM